jgi:hypothetical protein
MPKCRTTTSCGIGTTGEGTAASGGFPEGKKVGVGWNFVQLFSGAALPN